MITTRLKKKKQELYQFAATCSAGMEDLVREEVQGFGGEGISIGQGAVTWQGFGLESAYRACLWSRFASRVLVKVGAFQVTSPEELYQGTGTIDWDEHFSPDTTFVIHTTISGLQNTKTRIGGETTGKDCKENLTNSHYASLKVKDAIADQFRKKTGKRPSIDLTNPGIRIVLHLDRETATLYIDLSGESLHRRGYRTDGGTAPMKETLAAATVYLSGITRDISPDISILDPMCGSGTILIEAALIVGDMAPGLLRKGFGFNNWLHHNRSLWQRLVREAIKREDERSLRAWPRIVGYDADPRAISIARKNVINAGLKDRIEIRQRQIAQISPPNSRGIIVTNPPYGDRMSEKRAVKYLYRHMGRLFKERFAGWSLSVFLRNTDLSDAFGVKWQSQHTLYNGPKRCKLLVSETEEHFSDRDETDKIGDIYAAGLLNAERIERKSLEGQWSSQGKEFENRLKKNIHKLVPWAIKNNITCFRIYDADLPNYNMAIDIYERWVHVQEYAPPPSIPEDKARERLNEALLIIRHLLDVKRHHLFVKKREKKKGKAQYQKRSYTDKLYEVHEGGCSFLVNFTDYIDTGLFLDHRKTRALIAELSNGRTFLNLYGYTGSATVYAAKGGALSTTTVDMSEKYLIRAQSNMYLNGYGGPIHRFINEDCMSWLEKEQGRYGIIFVDPPTFSNARHKKIKFDVQKDHARLIRLAMSRLSRNGILIFSTNYRRFKLDSKLEQDFHPKDITQKTIPRDFRGKNPPIHRCWIFSRGDIPSIP